MCKQKPVGVHIENRAALERIIYRNINSLFYISILLLVVQSAMIALWFMAENIMALACKRAYLGLYIFLWLVGAVTFALTVNKRGAKRLAKATLRFFSIYTRAFSALMILWGVAITALDQVGYGELIAFVVSYMLCAVFIVIAPRDFLLIQSAPIALLYLVIYLTRRSTLQMAGNIVNVTILVLCVSISQYRIFSTTYENEKNMLRLQTRSNTDELTGLYNRHKLREYIGTQLLQDPRNVGSVGVMMIDIDDFKGYNDIYGHVAGDNALKSLGRAFRAMAQKHKAFCARYGGEEFIFLVKNRSREQFDQIARDIMEAVLRLNIIYREQPDGVLTISMGTVYEGAIGEGFKPLEAIKKADAALYGMKQRGKNGIAEYGNGQYA